MKPEDTPVSRDATRERPALKPYEKPQLQVYGDLADLAKAIAGSNTNDGAGHPNKHFTS